jgi:hypothetical protein
MTLGVVLVRNRHRRRRRTGCFDAPDDAIATLKLSAAVD